MISVEEALTRVLALAKAPRPEDIALSDALGRVMFGPATAGLTQPPFDASAMDGYAIRDADAAMRKDFKVIGEAAAGHAWTGAAPAGTAIRIFTGAPVPDGFDRVVIQENVTRFGDMITVNGLGSGSNIRPQGLDFHAGEEVFIARPLTARDIGLLASMNCPRLRVARRPKVSVIAGGDELVPVGQTPREGQIISSNDLAIAALARSAGAEVTIQPIARDCVDSIRESFDNSKGSDLIVTIGGASVGDHDLIAAVAADYGMERSFYKVAMRPGKPLMAGQMAGSSMIGLPGNPVSAMVCGIIFMIPLIYRMQGIDYKYKVKSARLSRPLSAEGDRQHYLRAKLDENHLDLIAPVKDQDSARQRLFSEADALIVRPAHDPARQIGELVEYLPL